jgi:mono/diheme cytochrome c family protein
MKKSTALAILALVVTMVFSIGCAQQPYDPPTPIPTLPPATLPVSIPTEAVVSEETAPTAVAEGEEAIPTPVGEAATTSEVDAIEMGAGVFQQYCVGCHNLTAETKVGPGLAGIFGKEQLPNGKSVSEENLKEWITGGGGAMPGIPLNDEQLAAVIAFLQDATEQ